MTDETSLRHTKFEPTLASDGSSSSGGTATLDGPAMYAQGREHLAKAQAAGSNEYKRNAHLTQAQAYFLGAMAFAVGELAGEDHDDEDDPLGRRWSRALAGVAPSLLDGTDVADAGQGQ